MHNLFQRVCEVLTHLGGFGVLALSTLDSSPLMIPFGNDLLLIAMIARKHHLLLYYVLMASFGSVLGCLIVDALSRKGGEKGLEKTLGRRRLAFVKRRVNKSAVGALAFAALMPPPFPFTGFVAGAAALQYPRKRLLTVLFISRLARFLIEGVLAMMFSGALLRAIQSSTAEYIIGGLVVVSIAGSAFAIHSWFRRNEPRLWTSPEKQSGFFPLRKFAPVSNSRPSKAMWCEVHNPRKQKEGPWQESKI
jgi:membrane protein YqaA with SNARE-associated domain